MFSVTVVAYAFRFGSICFLPRTTPVDCKSSGFCPCHTLRRWLGIPLSRKNLSPPLSLVRPDVPSPPPCSSLATPQSGVELTCSTSNVFISVMRCTPKPTFPPTMSSLAGSSSGNAATDADVRDRGLELLWNNWPPLLFVELGGVRTMTKNWNSGATTSVGL